MKAKLAARAVGKFMKKHASTIFTVLACAGVGATAYTSAKYIPKVKEKLEDAREEKAEMYDDPEAELSPIEKVKTVAPVVAVPVACGVATVGCIVAAHRIDVANLIGAEMLCKSAVEARDLLERKTQEVVGEKKYEDIQHEIAKEKVTEAVNSGAKVVDTGRGNVLFCDSATGQIFLSSHDAIRHAGAKLNQVLYTDMSFTINELAQLYGIRQSDLGDTNGWVSEFAPKMVQLSFHPVLDEDDDTTITYIDYYPKPIPLT